jgi:hypothetical protein
MANELPLEEWRSLIDHWVGQKRNIMHLEVPLEVAQQLKIKLSEEDMARRNARKPIEAHGVDKIEGEAPAAEGETPTWKRKAHFDGSTCGLSGCSRNASGYIAGTKPTGKDRKKVWFGPVCEPCCTKWNPAVRPYKLAELLINRSESELALLLDIEVGDLKKRLAAEGPLANTLQAQADADQARHYDAMHAGRATGVGEAVATAIAVQENISATEIVLTAAEVRIPKAAIEQTRTWAKSWLTYMQTVQLNSQAEIDQTNTFLQTVKGCWKDMDSFRKNLGAPLRAKLEEIQDAYLPTLNDIQQLEVITKKVLDTGLTRAKQIVEASFQAAQQAYHQGNVPVVAQATQMASHYDFRMPQGLRSRPVVKWEYTNVAELPQELWSWVPDGNKVQAAVDMGHRHIPGVRIWEENQLSSTSR